MAPSHPKFRAPGARRCLCGAIFSATLAGGGALAADFSAGVGAGSDRGRVDCVASFECDHSGAFAKAFIGYRWSDAVDLQLLYFDAGHFKGGDTTPLGTEFGGTFKVNGFGLSAGYRWNIAPAWSVTARAGAASVRTRFDYANDLAGSVSKTTLQPLAGIGIAYALTPQLRVGVDYDVTRFKVHTTRGSLQMLGLAAQFSF
jgi:opacity protein-like surface antigen